jgi:hypothetical protein
MADHVSSQGAFSRLLNQPPELVGGMLQWLEVPDLLSLRLTSRTFHNLVHDHETSICGRYCRQVQREHRAFQLPPTVYAPRKDLLHYIDLHRRYSAISILADRISNHVVRHIEIQRPKLDKAQEELWRSKKVTKLRAELFPALFLYNSFLECLYAVHLRGEDEFSTWDADEILSLIDVYNLDQQRIIANLDAQTIKNVSAAASIFFGKLRWHRVSVSMRSHTYPFATVKRILLASGILPFVDIMARGSTDNDMRNKLVEASDKIWHGTGRTPVVHQWGSLDSIHHLRTDRLHQTISNSPFANHKVQNRFIERQDIFNMAAFAVLQRLDASATSLPDPNQWLRRVIAEPGDPTFVLGKWNSPAT